MATRSLSWGISHLASFFLIIHMAQAGPMQEGFHVSDGLVNDLDHRIGFQPSTISHTALDPNVNYVHVRQTQRVLPSPAGYVNLPVPYFWEQWQVDEWVKALQENADSSLASSSWIQPVYPPYDLSHVPGASPYPISEPVPQYRPYPSAPNIHTFPDPASNAVFSNRKRPVVRPTRKQWRPSQSERKLKKNLGVSNEINTDDTSISSGSEQQIQAGQAGQMNKIIRPNLSQLEKWPVNRASNQLNSKPSHALDANSASFQPSTAPVPTQDTVHATPSSSLDQVSSHNVASVSQKSPQQKETRFQAQGESPEENRELALVEAFEKGNKENTAKSGETGKVQGTKISQQPPSASIAAEKHDTLVPPGDQSSDNIISPNQHPSASSPLESSKSLQVHSEQQEWQVYSKKNRKAAKYLQSKGGVKLDEHAPPNYGAEKIRLAEAQNIKDMNLQDSREEGFKSFDVEEGSPGDLKTSKSQANLDAEKSATVKSGEHKKKSKKNKKKGPKQSKAEPLNDDEVLNAADHLTPESKLMIQKGIWEMVKGDDPTPLLEVELNLPIYNQIFAVDAHLTPIRSHLIDQIIDQYRDDLAAKVSIQEATRRFVALQMQVLEETRLENWKVQKESMGQPVKEIMKMLKGDERWPVFYDAKPDDWRLLEKKISELTDQSRRQLESAMPQALRSNRLATIYASGQANKKEHGMMYNEKDLEYWTRQGVSAPLLIRVGDVLDLTAPKAHWDNLPEKEIESKAINFYNCIRGEIAAGNRLIYREAMHWYLSGARLLILQDPKYSEIFDSRLKMLVKFGENQMTIYNPTPGIQDQRLVKLADEKDRDFSGAEDQFLTFAEHMIGTHFGIPSEKILEFTRSLRLKNAVLKAQANRSRGGTDRIKPGITWPKSKSTPRVMEALKSQFRDFFTYLEIPFNDH